VTALAVEDQKMNGLRRPRTCFVRQYRRLTDILVDVRFLVERRSFVTASKRFGEFLMMLEQHLKEEALVLLPELERRTHHVEPARTALAHTGGRLTACTGAVAVALSVGDGHAFTSRMTELSEALQAHRDDEERLFHPAVGGVLRSEADWQRLCTHALLSQDPPHEKLCVGCAQSF
jgi:hypothetical protein